MTEKFANYRGDQQHIVYDAPKGPDQSGEWWRAVDADYHEELDRTRVTFVRLGGLVEPGEVSA